MTDKERAKALSNEGAKLLQQKMYDIAILKFDRAIELDPESVEVWHNKGLAYREAKKFEEAITCFDKALEMNPDLFRTMISKGDTFIMQKFNLEAAELFFILMKKGISTEKVEKRLERLKKEAGVEEALAAKSLYEQNKTEEALKQLEPALEKNPSDRAVHYMKGQILKKIGRHDEALLCFDEIIVKFPMADAYREKAMCLYEQGSYREANAVIKEYLNLKPDEPAGLALQKNCQAKMLSGAYDEDEADSGKDDKSREKLRENIMKVFCILGIIFFVYLWVTKTQRLINQLEKADKKSEKIEAISDLSSHKGDEVFNGLLKALDDKSPGVRATTVNALGALGDKRAIEPLLKILKEDAQEVRYVACGALGKLKAEEALPDLIDILSKDDSEMVRAAAAKALAAIGDMKAMNPLCEAAFSEKEIGARVSIIMALSAFPESDSLKTLDRLLSDDEERIRRNAAVALGNLGDKRAIVILKEALKKEAKESVTRELNKSIEKLEEKSD